MISLQKDRKEVNLFVSVFLNFVFVFCMLSSLNYYDLSDLPCIVNSSMNFGNHVTCDVYEDREDVLTRPLMCADCRITW